MTEYKEKYAIRILDSRSREGFCGELPLSTLLNDATSLELPQNEYISESMRAITTPDGFPDFFYSFENKIFSWCKKLEACPFKIYFDKILMTNNIQVCRTLMCYNLVNNFLLH